VEVPITSLEQPSTLVGVAETGVGNDEWLRLFSVLSHDLKSPIFAVDGFSDLLLSDYADKLDEDGRDFLTRIRSSAQHMKRVLDEMSHLIKLITREDARKPTPLHEIVEEVILKYNFMIEEGGVRVEVAEGMPTVNVDPEKTREAIGALVSNALFFNDRPKGEREISISATPEGAGARLCVRDNGIGVEPRYLGQIFDLGGASKLDRARGGGPGYGLYLAKRLVESQGGSITAESNPGEGSTFCISLP
jgi:signal transduction histidine kinase